ncbi:MAG TPA: hypothetical protein VIV66_06500 [Pyrinomonadaceae bacterium]
MNHYRMLRVVALVIGCSLPALAQNPKTFAKDGLTFNYPSAWSLQDGSKSDAQQLTLARADSDAQIRVFVYRSKIETPDNFTEAKHKLVDPYVDSTAKTFEQMGGRPERSPISSEIGGVKADGVKIRAILSGEPGAAEIYWAVVGERLVVMTVFGPDAALKQVTPAWDVVRSSVQIEGPRPEVKPPATPTPKP